jgi:hypothetical protein
MKTVLILLILIFVSSQIFASGGFSVNSVSPSSQSINAVPSSVISITFNADVDLTTFNDTTFQVWGRWSGVHKGTINFNGSNQSIVFNSDKDFFYGEWVTVYLSKGIKDALGNSLSTGYSWNFWIKTNSSSMNLTRIGIIEVRQPGEGWIQTYGTYAGDFDDDGWCDFLVPNEISNDIRIFMNDGAGNYNTFDIFQISNGSRPSTNEGADFNLDGLMDIAVGNSQNTNATVFLGDGLGGFSNIQNYTVGNGIRGLVVIDADGDGFTDIVTANRTSSNLSYLNNNGDGTFATAINFEGNGNGETALASADVNADGIMDLFVGAYNSSRIIVMLGNGNDGFTFQSEVIVGANPWMVVVGDFNNDGIPDVASANAGAGTLSVAFCDLSGNLQPPVHYPVGNFPISVETGDIDGDGDLDLATSNFGTANFTLYENDGTGNFINPQTLAANSAGSCAVFHDRDNDGIMDITGIDELDDLLILFVNDNVVNIPDDETVPEEFYLSQNFPNPFNPKTSLQYAVSSSQFISIKVYDILGNEITTLINEEKPAGQYEVEFNGDGLSSGMYFYTLKAGNFSETRKMILLK